MWASVVAAIAKLVTKLAPLLALWMAKVSGMREQQAKQDAINAKKAREYAEISSEPRTDSDTVDRMRSGGF